MTMIPLVLLHTNKPSSQSSYALCPVTVISTLCEAALCMYRTRILRQAGSSWHGPVLPGNQLMLQVRRLASSLSLSLHRLIIQEDICLNGLHEYSIYILIILLMIYPIFLVNCRFNHVIVLLFTKNKVLFTFLHLFTLLRNSYARSTQLSYFPHKFRQTYSMM